MGLAIPPNGDLHNFLDGIYRRWNGMAKVANAEIKKTKTCFTWDAIRDAVILNFDNESFESLMVQIYDEIVGRDDLALIMAYNINEVTDDKNYLLLDRTKKTLKKGDKLSKFIMDTFKQIPFLQNEPSPSYAEQVARLAELSMHSVAMQSVYKSNMKDKNGNIINTKVQMDALKNVVSQMTQYRRDHPEYYAAEKELNAQRSNTLYNTDAEFRKKMLKYTRDKYLDPNVKVRKCNYNKQYALRKKMERIEASLQNIQVAGQ
ncbi:hypothetical protein T492DRAFT_841954 [Pavlovales sp. CCMP2436]|nr:hypothetical protein T492DRAFT_841954 [Pavlovales sp. CCMP2436]